MTPLPAILATTLATIALTSSLLTAIPLVSATHTGLQAGRNHRHGHRVRSVDVRQTRGSPAVKRRSKAKKRKNCPATNKASGHENDNPAHDGTTPYNPPAPADPPPASTKQDPPAHSSDSSAIPPHVPSTETPSAEPSQDTPDVPPPETHTPDTEHSSGKCDGSFNGKKMGLSWNDNTAANMKMFAETGKVGWYYTWSSWPVGGGECLEHVPMMWGMRRDNEPDGDVAQFDKNFDPKKHKWILGYNEPDYGGQANVSPASAAGHFIKHLAWREAQKVSPAPTGGGDGSDPNLPGKVWLREFLAACNGACKISAIAVHWYGKDPEAFKKYVKSVYNEHKLPLWITEFACHDFGGNGDPNCSEAEVRHFAQVAIPFLKNTEYIARWAYFGSLKDMANVGTQNRLMDGAGNKVTSLGWEIMGM